MDAPPPQRGDGGWWCPVVRSDGLREWQWQPDLPPLPPPAHPPVVYVPMRRSPRRWPWIFTGAVMALVLLGVALDATEPQPPASATDDNLNVNEPALPAEPSLDDGLTAADAWREFEAPAPTPEPTPPPPPLAPIYVVPPPPPTPQPAPKAPDAQPTDWRIESLTLERNVFGWFDGRARITYSGPGVASGSFHVTLFKDGRDIATLTGLINRVSAGTWTVEFSTTDDYIDGPWTHQFRVSSTFRTDD
jgi:hypothetical protein